MESQSLVAGVKALKHAQPEDVQELLNNLLQDLQSINEELADFINTPNWNRLAFYNNDDDDDDEEYIIAITPVLPTEKPDNSLSMGDEHLSTIPEMELNELIKSSDENLVPIPSESEDFSDIKCKRDVPDCDDSQTTNFSKFSNPLFDDSTSSDDDSSHEEIIHEISFKTFSNPLFDLDEEIISNEFNPIHNEDLDSTMKNDQHEKYISLLERLLYDNSSPRSSEDFHTIIESLPTFPIPVEDSDSLREEIDIFPGPDDSVLIVMITTRKVTIILRRILIQKMERLILISTEQSNDMPSESETFCFNLEEKSSGNPTSYIDLSLPDYEAFFCDSEPDSGDFTMDVVEIF
ncbi:hypothetical protein Tco_1038279 [Tanacetum coccineum]